MTRPRILTLILAGGQGGRLDVLTERRAKPAIPFAGVYRLIDVSLSNCMHSGLSDVWIMEQYLPHSLNEHLSNGRPWDLDRTHGGLLVLPPYEKRGSDDSEAGFARGNADVLYRNRRFLQEFGADVLVVLSADHLYKLDYRDVIEHHVNNDADVTIVTSEVSVEEAGRFGVVQTEESGKVTGFDYKPEEPQGSTVTTEIFVYNAPALLRALEELATAPDDGDDSGLQDFGHHLIPHFVREGRARAFPLRGYWRDVGTVESYWQAHRDLLGAEPALRLDDADWPILTNAPQRLPARIEASARIDDSLISPGCHVAGTVVRSVLGPGVTVAKGAKVRDSVVLRDAAVETEAVVERGIIDSRATISAGACVGGEGGLTLVGLRAHVPSGARILPGERVRPASG